LPGLQRGNAGGNVFARWTHIGAGLEARGKHDPVAVDTDILLHEHGVGALRHRRAGEDAHRLSRFDRLMRGAAGLNAPADGKCLLFVLRQVAARNRIAIDGGVGERRQRQRRQNVVREDATIGAGERHCLDIDDRRYARCNETDGFIDRHHRPAERKAVVRQLRHLPAQPSASHFAITSSSEIADFSSIAATASISSRWAVGSAVSTAVSVAMPTMPGSSGNSSGFPFAAR
jgi:hypothetical protein